MMKVNPSFTSETNNILNKLQAHALEDLELAAEESLKLLRAAGVMPYRTGDLQNDTFVTRQGKRVLIVTPAKYASYLYANEKANFFKGRNPSAGPYWFSQLSDGRKRVSVLFQFKRIQRKRR